MTDKPPLPRWVRIVLLADVWIMARLMRPVWWIDHRFHMNNYRQAAWVMIAGFLVHVVGAVLAVIYTRPWFALACMALASVTFTYLARDMIIKLAKAGIAYDRDPSRLTKERAFFYWQMVPPMRLMFLVMGLQIIVFMIAVALLPPRHWWQWGSVAFNAWITFHALALYIAGVPPSPFERKKKEERAPLGALPLPA